jgi:biotin carboxyl carrier protein
MNHPEPTETSNAAREHRLSGAIILGVPIVLIVITFLFWYQTWFGRKLSDAEMNQYLQDTSVPHKTQHALTQVATEILQHDPAAARVYPQVVALAGNKEAGLRSMAAWVMGQDNTSTEFHQALLRLVEDTDPMVRWNAALGLARFGDAVGDAELRSMLAPYDLHSPLAGTVTLRVSASDSIKSGSVVARIKGNSTELTEIRSPLAGQVVRLAPANGATIAAGDEIAVISPDDQQLWEALRALYLVGGPDDLKSIEPLARPAEGVSVRVREQAALTAEAIRKRASNPADPAQEKDEKVKTKSAGGKNP